MAKQPKFRIVPDLDFATGRSTATVMLDVGAEWWPVFGPVDVTDLRGRDYEEDVHLRVGQQFAAALRAALESTS